MQHWLVSIRKDTWYACHWTVLVLRVLGDCTIIFTHTDPGMMPLNLHTAPHRRIRNDGTIDVIMVLLILGAYQGWNVCSMRENHPLFFNTQQYGWAASFCLVCFWFIETYGFYWLLMQKGKYSPILKVPTCTWIF